MLHSHLPLAVAFSAVLAACMPVSEPKSVSKTAESALEAAAPEPSADREEAPPVRGSYSGVVRRGVVTAGDIDDALNLGAFTRYLKRSAAQMGLPQLGLGAPVLVRLTGPDGSPAAGARYTLRRPGAAEHCRCQEAGTGGRCPLC